MAKESAKVSKKAEQKGAEKVAPAAKKKAPAEAATNMAGGEPVRKRGRPSTGNAKTPTDRTKALDQKILSKNGRILNKLRIQSEPAAALSYLRERDGLGTDRAAIEFALLITADLVKKNPAAFSAEIIEMARQFGGK
jgi:hypothetical protein